MLMNGFEEYMREKDRYGLQKDDKKREQFLVYCICE